jgi:hypothetical protein
MEYKKKTLENNLVDCAGNMLYCLTGKICFNRFTTVDKFPQQGKWRRNLLFSRPETNQRCTNAHYYTEQDV